MQVWADPWGTPRLWGPMSESPTSLLPPGEVLALEVEATDGAARRGVVRTRRGSFRTPCFMPVGTRATVRTLTSADLEELGAEVVLGNTYHLMLRPGADLVAELGGIHGFSDWHGHVLTDSGGYQIFSLEPKVDDEGATFRSTYDGSTHHLSPEGSVAVQQLLGSDIQMVLDVCPPLPSPPGAIRSAVDRSAPWARPGQGGQRPGPGRGLAPGPVRDRPGRHRRGPAGRERRADRRGRLRRLRHRWAVGGRDPGGDAAGARRHHAMLPPDRPRYLMGVGDPVSLVEAVALGVDMFDCVLPTRLARHGTVLTSGGRLNLRNARWARDPEPLEPGCGCPTCRRWSKAYLRHLLSVNEPSAARLTTLHNVHWLLGLMARTRDAVAAGTVAALRREVAERWD